MATEMSWNSQEQISMMFLEIFVNKYKDLMTAVSNYLSMHERFNSNFKTQDSQIAERDLIQIIKSNLVFVLGIVSALNKKNKLNVVTEAVEKMREVYSTVIMREYLQKEQLEVLNDGLATVVAEQFLGPLMRYRGGAGERQFGRTEQRHESQD